MSERKRDAQISGEKLKSKARELLTNNLTLKVLALLLSVVLWAGLISQDETLTREKSFSDVNVNITGTDNMKRNGYIVTSDLSAALSDIDVVAAVPQKQYDQAEATAYNLRVDLGRISGTGTQELRLLSTYSNTYGRVTSISPSSVTVDVEDYVVRYRIPVSTSIVGEIPEGWYISGTTVDPPLVSVSGPRSLVNSISRARVFLDPSEIEWAEGTTVFSASLSLYNRSGEEVTDSLLEVSYDSLQLDSVVLEATILPTKTFSVESLINTVNETRDGYEVKSVHVSPESITVAARREVLEQMTELALSEHTVDLSKLTETTTFQIRASKPSDDAILSNDTITVTVEIVQTEEKEAETPEG